MIDGSLFASTIDPDDDSAILGFVISDKYCMHMICDRTYTRVRNIRYPVITVSSLRDEYSRYVHDESVDCEVSADIHFWSPT
jgi:hypothetical protein